MHPLQEKFQILVPFKEETATDETWVSMDSQRDLNGLVGFTASSSVDYDTSKFNLPMPGMDIGNQWRAQIDNQKLVLSGETDITATKPANWNQGFTKLEMKGTDDCYTGEHVDLFYGDSGGFTERNNYLDRI